MKLRPVFPKDEAVGCKMENDVGFTSSTAHRWLSKYDFDNDELVPTEPISLPEEVESDDFLPTTRGCPNCGYEY